MDRERFFKKRPMPTPEEYDVKKTEYVGKDPEFNIKEIVMTTFNEKVIIMQYLKDKGFYVVMNIDEPGEISPAYKINPGKLRRIEEK